MQQTSNAIVIQPYKPVKHVKSSDRQAIEGDRHKRTSDAVNGAGISIAPRKALTVEVMHWWAIPYVGKGVHLAQ